MLMLRQNRDDPGCIRADLARYKNKLLCGFDSDSLGIVREGLGALSVFTWRIMRISFPTEWRDLP